MKKFMSVLLALMMLAACGTAGAEQEARKMETAADAEEWLRIFMGEHPEELEKTLKPCPFCGNEQIELSLIHPQYYSEPDMAYWCFC